MNKSIIIHEFKMMSTSRKNILFVISLVVLILSYCFLILPNQQTSDSFNPNEVKKELEDLAAIQKGKESRGATGFNSMSGQSPYAENALKYNIQSKLVTAFEDGDFVRFTHLRIQDFSYYGIMETIGGTNYFTSPFPALDYSHVNTKTFLRYEGYLNEKLPITYEMIEQKTALQTLQNFILGSFVLAIIFCAIYFSSDMLSKDKQNQTILQGLPISWYRLINLKSLVAFTYTMAILVGLLLLTVGVLTLLNGFGSFDIRIPVTLKKNEEIFQYLQYDYDTISMAKFLLMASGCVVILVFLFTRLNAILSLLFKNTWLVLMVSTIILFAERIYFSRTKKALFNFEISNYPQTYFEFGKVITGDKNFLVNLETITFEKGMLVLLVTLLIIEIVLFAVSRIVNKRRFYQGI
ncbi:hypothetical protein KDN24_04070 [Bacillus sp. Bva_UNVM-123]|uniref:ABC transporter permease subunit n=1 Tax=Bacillus sp. Bva_UNVM-123 TaxID=2829798 RepID=UPI00391F3C25